MKAELQLANQSSLTRSSATPLADVYRSRAIEMLRKLRVSQPFNSMATTAVRAWSQALGWRSEQVIKHLHRVGLVQSGLPNGRTLRLWSRGDDWVSNQVYWRGWSGYEPESVPLFFRLAAQARVTLDVGAYVGYYTLLAAHANPTGRVYAFEPLPTVYARLQRNVALNRLTNVECVAMAVGASNGTAEFFHVASEVPTSSSLSYEFMRPAGDLCCSLVPVTTLDQFVAARQLGHVDLVKIDTESTESQVLQGMQATLRRDRPLIICEFLEGRGSRAALEEILRPLGYRYYLLTPDGPEPRERIEGHPEWLNYLFTTLNPAEVAQF